MNIPNRVPKGVPTGGQFAEGRRDEVMVDIGSDDELRSVIAERRSALLGKGWLQPAAVSAALDIHTSAHRAEWWDRNFVLAEYDNTHGDYPQMPDDYTPSMTAGRSIAGNRRTHRMCYRGAGMAVRMPSVTSVRRFAKESGSTTFDVPVSAVHPGGEVTGWVRVTRGADGSFAVRGLGFSQTDSAYVAESVQCLLEARRPSRALAEVGDILERRRSRAAALGARVEPVRSGWVEKLGYDKATGTMVMTTGARRYGYDIPIDTYREVASSRSPGRVFNRLVKNRSTRIEVNECPNCHRIHVATVEHRCPPKEGPRLARSPLNLLHRRAAAL